MPNNLLLLHGALGSEAQFQNLKKLLEPHFKIYTFNFSGHGNRVCNDDFSMELFVEDVLGFMKDHSLLSTNIFGYSMGGYVGLKLAKEYPNKVQKLMTLGTKIDWNPESAENEIRMLNPQKMVDKIPQFVKVLKKEHYPNDWEMVVNKTAEMIHGLGNGKAMELKTFEKIEIPVLVAHGSEDSMVSKEESEALVKHLNKGRFMEILGAKHPIDKVKTNELANTLIDFL